jgi:hypothetical protein
VKGKTGRKAQQDMNSDSIRRATGVDLLKQLWNIRDKKPPVETPPPDVRTDIYSVPPTSRRIPHRPRPMK